MKTTKYFKSLNSRPDRAGIKDEWNEFFDHQAMKVKYFSDTDTLYIELHDSDIVESGDLDENTILISMRKAMYAPLPSSTRVNALI